MPIANVVWKERKVLRFNVQY